MYVSYVTIKGYKIFKDEFKVSLEPGLNIIIGENGTGKSAIIDAIRLVLLEDEYGRTGINPSDFHRPLSESAKTKGAKKINIRIGFEDLSSDEQVAYLPWINLSNPRQAILNLGIDNKEDTRGRLKRKIWANESETGLFEWELLNRMACIYLPPLRNAEDKLSAYKGSRLARLLKNLRKEGLEEELHPLEKKFSAFNKELLRDESIQAANKSIQGNLAKSVGSIFGQDASIQFAEINFDRIVEKLKLIFYPLLPKNLVPNPLNMFRELNENSLGYNNILYLATILAELEGLDDKQISYKVLLIEEPEAHLHPQLQIRLLQFLEEKAKAEKIQIIVTSHSPTLAASVNLNSIKLLTKLNSEAAPVFNAISDCKIENPSLNFLQRWLDITKSVLFFAKGILLVEGIAEALVIKELSKIILKKLKEADPNGTYCTDLEEYGISIINQNGIYFDHFMSLFQGYKIDGNGVVEKVSSIPIFCAGLTDNDPDVNSRPTPGNPEPGRNPKLPMVAELAVNSNNCRLFSNLKTFEYDLALEGANLKPMCEVLLALTLTNGPVKRQLEDYILKDWHVETIQSKSEAASFLLDHIVKGEYAQVLAQKIADEPDVFTSPNYIVEGIKWVIQ